jgi:hypothetical protein
MRIDPSPETPFATLFCVPPLRSPIPWKKSAACAFPPYIPAATDSRIAADVHVRLLRIPRHSFGLSKKAKLQKLQNYNAGVLIAARPSTQREYKAWPALINWKKPRIPRQNAKILSLTPYLTV